MNVCFQTTGATTALYAILAMMLACMLGYITYQIVRVYSHEPRM